LKCPPTLPVHQPRASPPTFRSPTMVFSPAARVAAQATMTRWAAAKGRQPWCLRLPPYSYWPISFDGCRRVSPAPAVEYASFPGSWRPVEPAAPSRRRLIRSASHRVSHGWLIGGRKPRRFRVCLPFSACDPVRQWSNTVRSRHGSSAEAEPRAPTLGRAFAMPCDKRRRDTVREPGGR
jgi:hypothetical protein